MAKLWEIWQTEHGEMGGFPANHPMHDFLSHDVDGVKMKLIHEFVVEDGPDEVTTVERTFAYIRKYQYNEGEWPEGCHAK